MDRRAGEIAERFGLGGAATIRGPVDRGELGELWSLDTDHGRYAVKVPFERVDPRDMDEPTAFADAVADAGILTPRFRRSRRGQVVEEVGDRQIVVLDWLDIAPVDKALDPAAVGALVGSLHGVPFRGTRTPHRWWYTEPVGSADWEELIEACRGSSAPFTEQLAAQGSELVALEALIDPLAADRTCHRDLWADNVRASSGGGVCVFDWDNCGPGNHTEELAMVLFEFGLGEPSRWRDLRDAYVDAGGSGRVDSTRAFSMLIAVSGHIGQFQVRNWLAAETDDERTRAHRAMDEFLGLPPHQRLDRAAVERILDAVA